MFNLNNHQPHHEADFLSDQPQDKENELIKSYRAFGNISEFGLYFSGGLALALLSRLIPGMLIAYGLLLMVAAGYLVLSGTDNPQVSGIIGLAIVGSVIAGFWDAIFSLIAMVNPLIWIGIGLVLFAIALSVFMRSSR